MASDKDININIKTTADTAGAKAVEDSLKKVNDASQSNPMLKSAERIKAENDLADAIDARAEATKKAAAAEKEIEKGIPALTEADVAAENVKKLGENSTKAVGTNSTGLRGLAQGLRGVVNDTGAGGGGGGLVSMAGSLIGVLNPIGLVTAAVGLVVGGLMKWKRSLDEAEEANERLNIEAANSAILMDNAARADELAAQAKRNLTEAQKIASNEINTAIVNIGNYNSQIQRTIDLEAEAASARKALAAEKLAVAIAEAGDDPEKVNQLRQQARQADQSSELAELDIQIAAEKKRQLEITAEITRALEQKKQFEEKAARQESNAEAGEEEAKGLRQLADQMNQNIDRDIKEANKKKGGATDAEWYDINQLRENAQRMEERASAAESEVEQLRENAKQNKDAAKETGSMVSESDKQLQTSVYSEEKLVRDKDTKSQIFEQRDKLGGIQTQQITERESKRREEEKQREKEKSDRDQDARRKKEAGIGKSAASLVPKGAPERLQRAINEAAAGLQDGDQGGEVVQLVAMMEELAKLVKSKGSKTAIDLENIKMQIKDLRS